MDQIQKTMTVPPEDSVYSYLLFMPPIEQKRSKRYMTGLTFFAFLLVTVNFMMQSGLLYVVGQHIMRKHTEWVSSIANLKHHAWYHVLPMAYNLPLPKCQGKDSPICYPHKDGISCSPLSVHLLAKFERLDTDGDGIWTQEEAEDKKLGEQIQCDYNVDLPSLYASMVSQINASHVLQSSRNSKLLAGVGLHKAYLDWYLHKPLLCQYGDQDMCGALFERGFFDEALLQRPMSEFQDTASALKYCNEMLQFECFDILPNTYRVWRLVANQQCGEKMFSQSNFHSPTDSDAVMPMLHVDFRKRREYASTKEPAFRLFISILLVTFLSVMALEMRSILKTFIWCLKFPADDQMSGGGLQSSIVGHMSVTIKAVAGADGTSDFKKGISAIRSDHRFIITFVTCVRLCLWFFLLWSGIMFLTGPPHYLSMIFDALSLVFIFEIDELLYRTMLRTEFRNDHMSTSAMVVPQWTGGRLTGSMMVTGDVIGFFFVIASAMVIVYTYTQNELNPLLDSLQCVCSVAGSQCFEANHYSKAWWDTYWSTTLPASMAIIEQLKLV